MLEERVMGFPSMYGSVVCHSEVGHKHPPFPDSWVVTWVGYSPMQKQEVDDWRHTHGFPSPGARIAAGGDGRYAK